MVYQARLNLPEMILDWVGTNYGRTFQECADAWRLPTEKACAILNKLRDAARVCFRDGRVYLPRAAQ